MTAPDRRHALGAAVLIAIFFAHSLSQSLGKSVTSDEPPHIFSGLAYVAKGAFHGNPQHPPLLKELSGLSLLLGGIGWPENNDMTERFLRGEYPREAQPEWGIGRQFIVYYGPGRVMFLARLPMILVACLLGVVLYIWGSRLLGRGAALGAVFLYATSPLLLGHSYLVTTDVGVSAFAMLFLMTLWSYVKAPSGRALAWCGVTLGLALCAKFSAVLLLPAAVLLLAASAWMSAPAKEPGRDGPCPCGSGRKYKACHGEKRRAAARRPASPWPTHTAAFAAMCVIAVAVISALYFFSSPARWLEGLSLVNADHSAGYRAFLAGKLAPRFYSYFAAAYLLKEPLAAIMLAIAGLVLLLRSQQIDRLAKLFLLVPPAAMFLGATLWAENIGLRYIMPVLPFAWLLGGLALAKLFTMPARWGRPAGVAACVWLAAAMAGICPDHLSYFNEAACLLAEPGKTGLDGGSRCGIRWLDDSNVDWGQGLKQLKSWQDANGGRPLRVVTPFGIPPAAYGIRGEPADEMELVDRPVPGAWYAVSAHLAARMPVQDAGKTWLDRATPAAVAGHSMYIYASPR